MKQVLFSLTLLITAHHLAAMNQDTAPAAPQNQAAAYQGLTPEEMSCFAWFHELSKEHRAYFTELSQEDREVLKQKLLLKDHPTEVRRSRVNVARAFIGHIQSKGIEPQYSEEQLVAVLVKVTKNEAPTSTTDSKQ